MKSFNIEAIVQNHHFHDHLCNVYVLDFLLLNLTISF